ncbi:MAG: hypothetical protein D9V44_09755 [Actinobacteria bacterium]|nr:MAG: hypothetical protein D9V44_09755 [Actinomycetota bacterium]
MARRLAGLPGVARLGLSALAGFLYGLIVSRIPAPADPLGLSAAYFVAPWIALPFLAGWLHRSVSWAAAAGVLTAVLCMFGFYLNAFPEYHPAYIALKESASGIALVLGSAVLWVTVNAIWYVVAVMAGIVFGLLGRWRRVTGSPVPLVVIATLFVLEPLASALLGGYLPRPYVVWVLEILAGLALLVWAVIGHRRSQVSPA